MRKYYKSLISRNHLSFRSYYTPVKDVIDGDLCELYIKLDKKSQSKIAKEMDISVNDLKIKLMEIRNRIL